MIDNKIDALITEWIDNNKASVLEKWIELAKIPSITSEPAENAPFGVNCARALEYASEIFSLEGFDCELDRQGGYALARYGEGKKKIGLYSHSDVVPVGEDWIYTKPFEPVIIDGALIGRGVEDNKSGIIHAYCLYKFLKDKGITLKNQLETFIGSDEECGMKDMDAYLEKHVVPDVSIVPDADFPCSIGEKGIYHFWAESRNAFEEVIDFSGGEAFNIVLDKATVTMKYTEALESEISDRISDKDCFILDKEDDKLKLTARGIAKHASIPEGSVNATYLLSTALADCGALCENDRKIMSSVAQILSSSYGESLGVAHEDKNFGRLTSVNGMVKTENGKISVSFDVRYGSTLSPEYLVEKSTETLSANGFDVTGASNSPGFAIEEGSEFPAVFEDIYGEIIGEKIPSIRMSGGTYARRIKNAFSIGTYAYKKDRTTPVFSMPDGHGGAHQCDEMIDIEGFFTAFRILVHYILACDELV